jgi:hypothetical protein
MKIDWVVLPLNVGVSPGYARMVIGLEAVPCAAMMFSPPNE